MPFLCSRKIKMRSNITLSKTCLNIIEHKDQSVDLNSYIPHYRSCALIRPVVDAQEQQLLRGGGDSIKAGHITNSRKLQALPNGSKKCIAGNPAKRTGFVWGETNTRDAPGGTRCFQSSKVLIVLFVAKCLCNTADLLARTSSLKILGSIINYNIEIWGETACLYLQSVGFNIEVGSFSSFPTDTSPLYTDWYLSYCQGD